MDQHLKEALPDFENKASAFTVTDGASSTATITYDQAAAPGDSEQAHITATSLSGNRTSCSEIGRAIDLLNNTASAVAKIHHDARRKQPLTLQFAKQAIDELIQNFADDPNTLFWALTANHRMHHLNRRSVGCAVWALALGHHLEFNQAALHELMLGALLLDIGKINVPIVIQTKAGKLNKAEQNFVRRHVADGIRMLESAVELSAEAIEMVRAHHERIDGSGYPFGLKGEEISLYAQIAGIIDSFDALSLHRYYADGLSGDAALNMLREQRGKKFAANLVDHFINAIGELPTGTWVQLPDGSTGVVCAQNPTDPGEAQVALIANAEQQPILAIHWLSLHEHGKARVLPPTERPPHAAAMERSLQAAIYAQRPRKY
ncbi:MAG: HD domain-containing protein [Gammaproteobacteria bacterium]|nr:HD domain-containing protein [Gammaproteobacteria bacterium]MCP4089393.1 HD domain-containing protein [Gammaproteobacteria bacterium]MCP4277508.1 HD domain-containing protein [Gammaproteobacteria bacterium]MCP4831116.1 HD domain-containing protein [Gammaproteobacteria bacterium]MCP4928540.1 HD domain-containing protein [Gammaproteobacteria bacterium]